MTRKGNSEGNCVKLPNGKYRFRIFKDGQRYSGTGATPSAARKAAEAKYGLRGAKSGNETMTDLFNDWSALPIDRLGIRATTRDQYVTLLRNHVVKDYGKTALTKLTPAYMAKMVEGFKGSASTRRSTYAALVRLLDYAVDRKLLGSNTARQVKRPSVPTHTDREVTATDWAQLRKVATGHRWEVAVYLSFGCGLRRGEVLGLRWSEIDLEAGSLRVTGNVTKSSAGLVRGAPKTRRGRRSVPLSPPVVQALERRRIRQIEERLHAGEHWTDTDLVLTDEWGLMVEPRAFSHVWRNWAKAAGVTDTGTHIGRRFAASSMLSGGQASVVDVANMLGHDPNVLMNTYATAVAQGQVNAINALGDLLDAPDDGANSGPIAAGH